MLQWSEWLTLAGIFLLGAMSPGPSLAIIVKHSVFGGRQQGMIAALAHGLGIGIYAALSVIGIASIMVAVPALGSIIQAAGALFLLYLATQAGRSALRPAPATLPEPTTSGKAWRDGFLIAFLNPKVPLFFVALFSQFFEADNALGTKGLIALLAMSIDTLWYLLVALLLSATATRQKFLTFRPWIEGTFAILLALLALRMLWQFLEQTA